METQQYTFMVTLSDDDDFILIMAECLNNVFKKLIDIHDIRITRIDSIYKLSVNELYTYMGNNNIDVELVYRNIASYK